MIFDGILIGLSNIPLSNSKIYQFKVHYIIEEFYKDKNKNNLKTT